MASLENAKFLLSETDPAKLGPSKAEIAFVGRSNVGKSTLINALLRRPLARVSSTPGCTRTINVYEVQRDRWLVDLPGYGYAGRSAGELEGWAGMIEGYLSSRPALRTIFALVDAKVGPTKLDLQMLSWLEEMKLPWSVIATKVDQVKPSRLAVHKREVAQAMGVEPDEVAWVSAEKSLGVRELQAGAAQLLLQDPQDP